LGDTGLAFDFEVLLVGFYERGKFMFAGKVTQGLNPSNRAAVFKLINRLKSQKCRFANLPQRSKGSFGEGVTAEEMGDYVWVVPTVVVDIDFAEWTRGGVLRHAQFVRACEESV
jgi:bifunctional non-homologous end joining protein LigD